MNGAVRAFAGLFSPGFTCQATYKQPYVFGEDCWGVCSLKYGICRHNSGLRIIVYAQLHFSGEKKKMYLEIKMDLQHYLSKGIRYL